MSVNRLGFVLSLFILAIFSGCGENKKYEGENFNFGTTIKVVVYGSGNEKYVKEALEIMRKCDERLNNRAPNGEFKKINDAAGKNGIIISNESLDLIKRNFIASNITEGKYDVTMSPLFKLWGFEEQNRTKLPERNEIESAKKFIDYKKVEIKNNIIKMPAGFSIETGPFLKGYGIALASEELKKAGVKSALLTGVSSITAIGKKPDGKNWKIGLQNPKEPSEILGVLSLDDKSVGVSGDYQTFIEIDGKKYHHILSLENGMPVDDIKLVVVISDSAEDADIYDTALFACGKNKIEDVAAKIKGIEWLYVDSKMEIHMSKGMNKYFTIASGENNGK